MILTRVIHQQILQLRWHLAACVGVVMVLPLEELVVNLRDPQGQFEMSLAGASLGLVPLLAALLACANVQADLDERRDPFWRSKPVRVGPFLSLKFVVGWALALGVLLCPVLFTWVTAVLARADLPFTHYGTYVGNIVLISLLAYSLGFLCNVLVRRTARAWLIGMTLTGVVLLLPFLLAAGYTDVRADLERRFTATYLVLALGTALGAFTVATLAAQRNWHLRTDLKRLLWAGAVLLLTLTLLGTRQVASIVVRDEMRDVWVSPPNEPALAEPLQVDDVVLLSGVETDGARTGLRSMRGTLVREVAPAAQWGFVRPLFRTLARAARETQDPNLRTDVYPRSGWQGGLPLRVGDRYLLLALLADYRVEKVVAATGMSHSDRRYERLTLCSFAPGPEGRFDGQAPRGQLDLSASLNASQRQRLALRWLGRGLFVAVNNQVLSVDVTEQGALSLRERARFHPQCQLSDDEPFVVPLIPLADLDPADRVRLSIDLVFWPMLGFPHRATRFEHFSLVDDAGAVTRFAWLDGRGVYCYQVLGQDDRGIRCRLRSRRPFTWLEGFNAGDPYFVQDGKLYAFSWDKLVVFDLRSDRGLRKLGHFQRLQADFRIQSVFVEDDGDILLFRERWRTEVLGGDGRSRLDAYLLAGP